MTAFKNRLEAAERLALDGCEKALSGMFSSLSNEELALVSAFGDVLAQIEPEELLAKVRAALSKLGKAPTGEQFALILAADGLTEAELLADCDRRKQFFLGK